MMNASVVWQDGLSFTASAGSGFSVPLGTNVEYGGANDGFRPLELMLVSLGGCTAMDVISILRKKRQAVTWFEVDVHGERAHDHPQVFTSITVEYEFRGHHLDPAAVERAIELSETKYCSARAMLENVVPIHRVIRIEEEMPEEVQEVPETNAVAVV
jgi:putative redox protein